MVAIYAQGEVVNRESPSAPGARASPFENSEHCSLGALRAHTERKDGLSDRLNNSV